MTNMTKMSLRVPDNLQCKLIRCMWFTLETRGFICALLGPFIWALLGPFIGWDLLGAFYGIHVGPEVPFIWALLGPFIWALLGPLHSFGPCRAHWALLGTFTHI